MSRVNKVTLVGRQVFKNKAKNNKPRKKQTFDKDEQPVSHSDRIADTAQKKGTKPVMSNKQEEDPVHFNGGDYQHTDDNLNPDYDSRAHPHWY